MKPGSTTYLNPLIVILVYAIFVARIILRLPNDAGQNTTCCC